jgi:hypothetical protein
MDLSKLEGNIAMFAYVCEGAEASQRESGIGPRLGSLDQTR